VLNGAHIGTGSIVAAGAVVPEGMRVPPHSLVAGVPARVRRSLTQADLDLIRMYANNYLEYTQTYLTEQGRSGPPK
jgi:carbonic anhydrase/acetyltransferase-like protein (isoleucine patch superfamily)